MIDEFICVLETGISQEEYKKRKGKLNDMIDNKIKTGKSVNELVESIAGSQTVIS